MSPTTEDLRDRLARELDSLAPMPDVVPAAAWAGSRRLRRRRAGGSVVAATAVVACALAIGNLRGGAEDRAGEPASSGGQAREASDPVALALRDGVVTQGEWVEAQRATFTDVLPTRFVDVALVERSGQPPSLKARVGDQDVEFHFGVQGFRGPRDLQPGTGGCAGLRQVAADSPFRWDILDCAEGTTGPGITVLADSEWSVASDSQAGSHASAVVMVGDGLFMEIGLLADGGRSPIDLTADEMVAMVREPEFLELAELGTTYAADLPRHPDEATVPAPDPVWPSGADGGADVDQRQ